MIDLFDSIKIIATSKNKPSANFMTQRLIFKNDKIIDNVNINEETIVHVSKEKNDNLIDFVDVVDKIKQEIQKINSYVSEISLLNNKINISITVEEENELSLQLNTLIKSTNDIIQSIKIDIRNLRIKYIVKSHENKTIKKNIHDNLINIFKKSLYSYQHIQNVFHSSMKDKMSRHIKIIYPNYNDDDINYILNHEDINTQNLVKWKLQGHEDLKNALTDVETKCKDVKTLEKSVYDLHQTIVELSAIIEMNDEIIDDIHENIKDAQNFTEKANVDLKEARKIQKQTSKWMAYITIGIFIVIIIICIPVLIKFV